MKETILRWIVIVVILGLVVYAYHDEDPKQQRQWQPVTPELWIPSKPDYVEKEWYPDMRPDIPFNNEGRNWNYE